MIIIIILHYFFAKGIMAVNADRNRAKLQTERFVENLRTFWKNLNFEINNFEIIILKCNVHINNFTAPVITS